MFFSFTACGDMLRSLRQESLDVDQSAAEGELDGDNSYAYRPRRLNGLSANNSNSLDPPVRRAYNRGLASAEDAGRRTSLENLAQEGKRYTKDDFIDKRADENSLWDAQGQSNYLFTHNRKREKGDMLSVDVERELRREIQYSLWLTLPPEQRKPRRLASAADPKAPGAVADAAGKSAVEKGKDDAEEAAKTNIQSAGSEDDIVRMEVAENMGNGLVRLIGTKKVIYRGVARTVEVVALVNNKDIDDGNHLKSSAFLDMQTQVVQ